MTNLQVDGAYNLSALNIQTPPEPTAPVVEQVYRGAYFDEIIGAFVVNGQLDPNGSVSWTIGDVVSVDVAYQSGGQKGQSTLFKCIQTYVDNDANSIQRPDTSPAYWELLLAPPVVKITTIPDGIDDNNPFDVLAGNLYTKDGALYQAQLTYTLTYPFEYLRTAFTLLAGTHYYYKDKLDPQNPTGHAAVPGDFFYDPVTKKQYESKLYGQFFYDPLDLNGNGAQGMDQLVANGDMVEYTGLATVDFVRDNFSGGSGGGGSSTIIRTSAPLSVGVDGAQTLTLPEAVDGIINLLVSEAPHNGDNVVRPIYPSNYSVSGNQLTITAIANLSAGEEVTAVYFLNGSGGGGIAPAPVASSTLEFVFQAGFADDFTTTIGTNQAGRYTSSSTSNTDTVQYLVNGMSSGLPLTLSAGDTFQVVITRQQSATGAVVTITT